MTDGQIFFTTREAVWYIISVAYVHVYACKYVCMPVCMSVYL